MDNQTTESTSTPLDVNSAAEAFEALADPTRRPASESEQTPVEAEAERQAQKEEPAPELEDDGVTVEIDGKTLRLTKAQIAESYKSGLRQEDYTRKTMAAAQELKSANAEKEQARNDRQNYAQNLQKMASQLEGAMQEQQRIDWDDLIANNPQEALKQQHLYNKRQAAYQQNSQALQVIQGQVEAEQAEENRNHQAAQQDLLLAKLPEWKSAEKAATERDAIKQYLKNNEFDEREIGGIRDHRAVLLARKAMLFDQMVDKASAARKRVTSLPARVERPGVADSTQATDGRTSAMQRLSKSGRVEDAAAVFSSLFS